MQLEQLRADGASAGQAAELAMLATTAIEGADYKVILAGRQGSDSDNGQVPLILATLKGWGCVSFAKKVEVSGDKAVIECEADGGEAKFDAGLADFFLQRCFFQFGVPFVHPSDVTAIFPLPDEAATA
mgnify:CR=1 FL=1